MKKKEVKPAKGDKKNAGAKGVKLPGYKGGGKVMKDKMC
jgi:hypothetical protein